jgi:hypothetical protein
MNRLSSLLVKRDSIVTKISKFHYAIAGNLSKSQIPPGSGKYYWRITWKKKQKTKIQYIRQNELDAIREGIDQFIKLRQAVLQLGEINRAIILLQRDR